MSRLQICVQKKKKKIEMLLLGVVKEGLFFLLCENGYPITKFTWIESPVCVDTHGFTNAILCSTKLNQSNKGLEEYLESVFICLVEVNFDGASVMSGRVRGVPAWLKGCRDTSLFLLCSTSFRGSCTRWHEIRRCLSCTG